MKRLVFLCALVLAAAGCGGDDDTGSLDAGTDSGEPVPCATDDDCPLTYCNAGSLLCCRPAEPAYEICGDLIDQDCDQRDTSCGDTDRDGVQACRPGEEPIGGGCDCDDARADVRPPVGALAGAPEACDGVDNDCNGRIDESAQCCEGCASLGSARDRADVCTVDGVCDCSTDAASGPCAEGFTCCVTGCVDVTNDVMNCGFCAAQCTQSADRCVAGACSCGETGPCDLDFACTDGVCATE